MSFRYFSSCSVRLIHRGLLVLDAWEDGKHRPGVSVRTDGRDAILAGFLFPIGRIGDSDRGLTGDANDGLSARFHWHSRCGGKAPAYIVTDVERVFDYVHDREDWDSTEWDNQMENKTMNPEGSG